MPQKGVWHGWRMCWLVARKERGRGWWGMRWFDRRLRKLLWWEMLHICQYNNINMIWARQMPPPYVPPAYHLQQLPHTLSSSAASLSLPSRVAPLLRLGSIHNDLLARSPTRSLQSKIYNHHQGNNQGNSCNSFLCVNWLLGTSVDKKWESFFRCQLGNPTRVWGRVIMLEHHARR